MMLGNQCVYGFLVGFDKKQTDESDVTRTDFALGFIKLRYIVT